MSHCSAWLMHHGPPKCILSSCLHLFSLQTSLPFSSFLTTSIFVLWYPLGWILPPFLHYMPEEGALITEEVWSFCCLFFLPVSLRLLFECPLLPLPWDLLRGWTEKAPSLAGFSPGGWRILSTEWCLGDCKLKLKGFQEIAAVHVQIAFWKGEFHIFGAN